MNVLKRGSRGEEVRELQKRLNMLGYFLEVDGIFGPATRLAVLHLQQVWGYDVDGIVGKGTNFCIEKRLSEGWNVQQPDAIEKAQKRVREARLRACRQAERV